MNSLDTSLIQSLHQFAPHSALFYRIVAFASASALFKGDALIVVLWWCWFSGDERVRQRRREILLATIAGILAAVVLGRLLAHYLPFRVRPIDNAALGLRFPYPVDEGEIRTWSSLPSDHAMVFATMATGLFFICARLGAAAHLYAFSIIGLPRLYLGLHYPTDILIGAAFGIGIGLLVNIPAVRVALVRLPLAWMRWHAGSFYAFFVLFTFQLSSMFYDLRRAAGKIAILWPHATETLAIGLGFCALLGIASLLTWLFFRSRIGLPGDASVAPGLPPPKRDGLARKGSLV